MRWALLPLLVAAFTAWAAPAAAQNDYSNPNMTPVNDLPNPYSEKQLMPLPDGRHWGSTAGVDAAKGTTTYGPSTGAAATAAWVPTSTPSSTTTRAAS